MRKIVYTKKLAEYLVKKGFKCLETQINIKDPQYLVFIFERTPELEEAINEYIKQCKEER